MIRRIASFSRLAPLTVLSASLLVGCGTGVSEADRTTKREQDRMAYRADAMQRERDEAQAALKTVKADLEATQARNRELQARIENTQAELNQLKTKPAGQ